MQRSPGSITRRGQITAAAVQVPAESGYGRTTFERVRQRAGISSAPPARIARDPGAVRAAYEIHVNARDEESSLRHGSRTSAETDVRELEPILRAGRQSGGFRDFDTTLMALTLKPAIDAAIVRMTQPPRLSTDDCVHEITALALLAPRRTPT